MGRAPESSAESLGEQGLGGETEREQPVEQDAGFLLADVERIFKRGIMMFDEHEDLRGREKKVSKATPSHYGTQARSPRIEPGKQGRPSGLFAGAVPVFSVVQREPHRQQVRWGGLRCLARFWGIVPASGKFEALPHSLLFSLIRRPSCLLKSLTRT